MAVDAKAFKKVMGRFASGVTVVAVAGSDGLHGITVSSFASLSLDPPLVLVCIDHRAVILPHLRSSKGFSVNVLAEDQREISDWFAYKARSASHEFEGIAYAPGRHGNPLLEDALARVECDLEACHQGGDHDLVVGRVMRADLRDESARPLLYYAGGYRHLQAEP